MKAIQIHGARKALADARLAAHAVWLRRGLGPSRPRAAPRSLSTWLALLKVLSDKKYVRFGDALFIDAFFPRFPDPTFDRLAIATGDGSLDGRTLIPYALLGITERCDFHCHHCCRGLAERGEDPLSLDEWRTIIDRLQEHGVAVVSFEGGEPLQRFEDLVALCRHAARASEPWIVTTGQGLDRDRARRLAEAGLAGALVSLDHHLPAEHNRMRGHPDAFDLACAAVELFREAGVFPALNLCATRELLAGDGLYRYLELAHRLGAGVIQVLDPIQTGTLLGDRSVALTRDELETLSRFQREANTSRRWRDHPAVSVRALLESNECFGCGAGGSTTLYVDAHGNLQPCGFLGVTTGNLVHGSFDEVLGRMQELFPHPVSFEGSCPANELRAELAEAHRRTGTWPLPYDEARRLCARFAGRPRPRLS